MGENIIPPDTTVDGENVVSFFGKERPESGLPLSLERRKLYCAGWCRRVLVREERRDLICQDCGRVIDCYDYLHEWAARGDNRMARLKELTVEIKKREGELLAIRADVDNAKAQRRRAIAAAAPTP